MNFKNIQNIIGIMFIVVVVIPLSVFADGSILVYNNSLYKLNFVVTTESAIPFVQASIVPAQKNPDGSLAMHPIDTIYVEGSNVPLGTIANVMFPGTAVDFDVQILDASDNIISQINLGTSLGVVVDSDPARVIYVYNNVTSDTGVSVPNSGGVVVLWDATHSLNNPSVQTFPATVTT
ncbi:MAG: hypothetical protein Q8Q60_03985 [Candidatus Chromulinivorax sp.]|nr:hypothetical protein [Candidatus Chromulinivorax sp.]